MANKKHVKLLKGGVKGGTGGGRNILTSGPISTTPTSSAQISAAPTSTTLTSSVPA